MKKILLIVLSLLVITGCSCNKKEQKNNNNRSVIKDQIFDKLKFTNLSIKVNNGVTTVITRVENNTGVDLESTEFSIIIKDKNGNEIDILNAKIDAFVKNGEYMDITSKTNKDIKEVAIIEYKLK